MTEPQVGLPLLSTPTQAALQKSGYTLAAQQPLPALVEPDPILLENPSAEPLVELSHPEILWLSHYEKGRWSHAISKCWLRPEVVDRLIRALAALPNGFGLAVFDAWRPRNLQAELYDHAYADPDLPPGFLAVPTEDSRLPAPHETGGAVDLTLTVGGIPIAAGTDFDDFTPLAACAALEQVPGVDRAARRLLYSVMSGAGFVVLQGEWWHFEYGTTRWAAITGATPSYGTASPETER